MKVVITSGPTREPIDDVRYVSNLSRGLLGKAVAEAFLGSGHQVVFLHGGESQIPETHPGLEMHPFGNADSLLMTLCEVLEREQELPLLIHAAAVADYAPDCREGKISSAMNELQLNMKPTPKVVDEVCSRFEGLPVIAFKLGAGVDREELHRAARDMAKRVGARAVVANRLEDVGSEGHIAYILRRDGTSERLDGREAIGHALVREAEALLELEKERT